MADLETLQKPAGPNHLGRVRVRRRHVATCTDSTPRATARRGACVAAVAIQIKGTLGRLCQAKRIRRPARWVAQERRAYV